MNNFDHLAVILAVVGDLVVIAKVLETIQSVFKESLRSGCYASNAREG